MDVEEFRRFAPKVIDYIVNYLESISKRSVTSDVSVGYLKSVLSPTAPNTGEPFDKIMEDLQKYIMPGLIHWQHPAFFSYYPTSCSYPSILAEMFKDTIGSEGFNGVVGSSIFELNATVMDWYGKLIGLPNSFLRYAKESSGGAVMDTSGSQCILNSMLCARKKFLKEISEKRSMISIPVLTSSLVAYCSDEAHSGVNKAAMISMVTLKILESDENFRLRGDTLRKAIKEDKKIGFIPFFVNVTIGTYAGACDPIEEIGPICEKHGMWLHVDGAYAGTAMMCPEFKHFLNGIEYASTFNANPAKWMLMHLGCSILFAKDFSRFEDSLMSDRTILDDGLDEKMCVHGMSSESLKLWFVMTLYGVEGLQNHIRWHVRLAKIFEDSVRTDGRFEILTSQFGIVCFRLNKSDAVNRCLLNAINASNKLLLSCHKLKGRYAIRFTVCNERVTENDVKNAWAIVSECADEVLQQDKKITESTEYVDEYKYSIP